MESILNFLDGRRSVRQFDTQADLGKDVITDKLRISS